MKITRKFTVISVTEFDNPMPYYNEDGSRMTDEEFKQFEIENIQENPCELIEFADSVTISDIEITKEN